MKLTITDCDLAEEIGENLSELCKITGLQKQEIICVALREKYEYYKEMVKND